MSPELTTPSISIEQPETQPPEPVEAIQMTDGETLSVAQLIAGGMDQVFEGYRNGVASKATTPEEAARMYREWSSSDLHPDAFIK